MAIYRVNPDTVAATGLKFRSAPRLAPETLLGILNPGDTVEETGPAQDAPPLIWLPLRVVASASIAAGSAGYAALSNAGDTYLVPINAPSTPAANPLLDATAQVAALTGLPALLLKAFMAVEGADVNHRDGVLQVIPSTRSGVIARISRANKLAALGLSDSPAISGADLNNRFAQAFDARNLIVQVMTGAQYIREQLDQFNGIVALAGLAYNAGPGAARSVINASGADPYRAAAQYHKTIGPAVDQVTVQPGIDQVDPATGVHYTRFPVTANDTGREVFDYQYLRQAPSRNFGLLDFIENPPLLAPLNLYQNDAPPGKAGGGQVLAVANGTFRFANIQSSAVFAAPPLSQRDPQWRDQTLGFGDPSTTIGSDGCTLTCLTMLADGFSAQETPATLNRKLKALGANVGFSGALIVWAGLPAALPGIALRRITTCTDRPAPMGEIDAALDSGMPVVVELDQSPAPGFSNHWVVLVARRGGDYLIHDPWPIPAEPNASLQARYGFAGAPAQVINVAVYYTGVAGQSQPQPLLVTVLDTPDIAAAGGLALRDSPVIGTVKTRLPAGALLQVQESPDTASPKIGQSGQWLQVSAPGGASGYVAAWLVQAVVPKGIAMIAPQTLLPAVNEAVFDGVVQLPLARTAPMTLFVKIPKHSTSRRALLRQGSGRGKPVTALAPGERLNVAEPAESAARKLGRRGAWISVIDDDGRQGYVSAASVRAGPLSPQAESGAPGAAQPPARKDLAPFMLPAK
ncbi:MAG: hypothetical protein M1434_02655 [Chloroflexi bacterium]|nr:hypothetical protein [Chloroflexota bacterium]MCL5273630.1 hypothetical protein [Chloroflexota bacterium]